MVIKYPAPGRGAWRRAGGLLPARSGSLSQTGYYRLAVGEEIQIGSPWLLKLDASHDAQVVSLGVQVVQVLVGVDPDGWFGPMTAAAVKVAQQKWGVDADGLVGRTTMRAGLTPVIRAIAAAHNVPTTILGGLVLLESSLDPAAVGVNGQDHGLAQINLGVHGDSVSLADAMDEEYALHWAAADLSEEYDKWRGRTSVDRWDIAIAHHNSPRLAKQWAESGTAPVVEGRPFQIADYVKQVRTGW